MTLLFNQGSPVSEHTKPIKKLADNWPPEQWQNVTVLVAVSGGADSVGLLRMLGDVKREGVGQVIVAHFHHGLRGAAADKDAIFVQRLADELGLEFQLGKAADIPADQPLVSEDAARQARYRFLLTLAEQRGARYIVTAHTAEDQTETILHRILRGTGIQGLAGIQRMRRLSESVAVVRPLLTVSRAEILGYLASVGQEFRVDETNKDHRFTRNRIRHELLPELRQQYNRNIDEALTRLGQLASEAQAEIESRLADYLDSAVHTNWQDEAAVSRPATAKLSPFMQRELTKLLWSELQWPRQQMGFDEWELLASMLSVGTPQHATLPGNVLATCTDKQLVLTRRS